MIKVSRYHIATLGFSQCLALPGTVLAQNTFGDFLCQPNQDDPASCEDLGCQDQGGHCTPTQAQTQDGQETQGCICDLPGEGQGACQEVIDHQTGNALCVDLMCPPMQEYNCDADCQCLAPNQFGQENCQPNQQDPLQCDDLGCSQQGGICVPTQAQIPPTQPGQDQEEVQGCHCETPDQNDPPQGVGGCEIVFDHMTGIPVCADLDCGSMALYECDPLPCDCLCDPTIPPEVLNLQWSTKVNYGWDPAPCAVVYNVYRNAVPVPALPGCGPVACSYGPCFWSALVATTATDVTVPPSGLLHHYLITGENHIAEGIMGFPSAPVPRPNLFSCPSPPPLLP